jgi:hypothetical protein
VGVGYGILGRLCFERALMNDWFCWGIVVADVLRGEDIDKRVCIEA